MKESTGTQGKASRLQANRRAGGLAQLVDQFADRIYRFVLAMTRDEEMAKDLTQEIFLKLQKALSRQPDELPAAAFVYTVARNATISRLRRRKLEESHLSHQPPEEMDLYSRAEPLGDPMRELERKELRAALLSALAAVPTDLREVFLLSEIEGFSYNEIAAVLGCPAGTIASRKHHAVRRLRETLRRQGFAL